MPAADKDSSVASAQAGDEKHDVKDVKGNVEATPYAFEDIFCQNS